MLIESFVKETQSSPCGALVRHTVTLTGPAFRTRLATAPPRSSPLPGPGYLTARPSSAPGPGSTKRQGRQHSGSPDDGNCPGPVDYPPGQGLTRPPPGTALDDIPGPSLPLGPGETSPPEPAKESAMHTNGANGGHQYEVSEKRLSPGAFPYRLDMELCICGAKRWVGQP